MDAQLQKVLETEGEAGSAEVSALVDKIIAAHDPALFMRAVELLCSDKVMLAVSKPQITKLASTIDQYELDDVRKLVKCLCERTTSRSTAFEEAIVEAHEKAAARFEQAGCAREAANELVAVYDTLHNARSEAERTPEQSARRVALCAHAAALLIGLGDNDSASSLLSRVADRLVDLPPDHPAALQYKLHYARLFDLRHDFMRAAQKYYELAHQHALSEQQRAQCLVSSAQCAVLADAGPERSRMLAALLKDEHAQQLPCAGVLKKVYYERILRKDDIAAFESTLPEHQKALPPTADAAGSRHTPLARAVIQHNLFSAANIYANIRLQELGTLLGISADEAERVAANMIRQKRIDATIDQVDGLLVFGTGHKDPLVLWDGQIDEICNTANDAAEMIRRADAAAAKA